MKGFTKTKQFYRVAQGVHYFIYGAIEIRSRIEQEWDGFVGNPVVKG
jgi:hypothetical protein